MTAIMLIGMSIVGLTTYVIGFVQGFYRGVRDTERRWYDVVTRRGGGER